MKECVVCRTEIHEKALKCIHCDSYQGLRRYLAISSNFATILVALVSALTTLITLQAFVFKSNNSEFQVTYVSAKGEVSPSVTVLVTNSGDQPGILITPEFWFRAKGTPYRLSLHNVSQDIPQSEHWYFEANESKPLSFKVEIKDLQKQLGSNPYSLSSFEYCHVVFHFRDFKGDIRTISNNAECGGFFGRYFTAKKFVNFEDVVEK